MLSCGLPHGRVGEALIACACRSGARPRTARRQDRQDRQKTPEPNTGHPHSKASAVGLPREFGPLVGEAIARLPRPPAGCRLDPAQRSPLSRSSCFAAFLKDFWPAFRPKWQAFWGRFFLHSADVYRSAVGRPILRVSSRDATPGIGSSDHDLAGDSWLHACGLWVAVAFRDRFAVCPGLARREAAGWQGSVPTVSLHGQALRLRHSRAVLHQVLLPHAG